VAHGTRAPDLGGRRGTLSLDDDDKRMNCSAAFLTRWISAQIFKEVVEKHGYLTKQGFVRKNWKRRYCILQSGKLAYYKHPQDKRPAGEVILSERSSILSSENDPYFRVVTEARTFTFCADSAIEANEWVYALRILVRCAALLQCPNDTLLS